MDEAISTGTRKFAEESQDHSGRHQEERPSGDQVAGKALRRLPKLPVFWTIGRSEQLNLAHAIKRPLSGYLGGKSAGGYWTTRLADEWSSTFGCRYSIPCNSATSGLLAACMSAEVGEGDIVWVSDYTMTASATCAMILGAEVELLDIDADYFCMSLDKNRPLPKAIIVTNLFGCPASLVSLRQFCDLRQIVLIEDNAQAPFARLDGRYTGTIGHIGVFSLNVHKHLQSGEGGVIVTDDPSIAHRLDCAINHGELMRTDPQMGLNLRMTEPIAAIASAQLKKGAAIVQTRIALAHAITDCFKGIDFVEPPAAREGTDHVYYLWAGKIKGGRARERRGAFLESLQDRGIPFRVGYSIPLHRVFNPPEDEQNFPVTNEMEDNRLFCFEICAFDPKVHHIKLMKQIIHEEAKHGD
jgi:perosamine synthetase